MSSGLEVLSGLTEPGHGGDMVAGVEGRGDSSSRHLGLRCQLLATSVLCQALSCLSCLTQYRSPVRPFAPVSLSWLMALAAVDLQ